MPCGAISLAPIARCVGKAIVLNRVHYTVIGIARPGFTGTEPIPSAFWVPVTMSAALEPEEKRLANDNMSWLAMLGRMRPKVSPEQVRSDLDVIAQRINQQYPGRTTTLSIHTARYLSSPEERQFLIPVSSVILAAFGLVLLIACANVTNLLLARASVRQKEIALRLSLGAGRGRLVRQLLTESLLLSMAGGILGSIIACWSFMRLTGFITSHLPGDFPPISINATPDLHVLFYALLLTFCTGIAFGLVPALQSTRPNLNSSMQGDGAAVGGKRRRRFLLKALVGAQVAVCMVLLMAAGLLLRGLYYAQTVDPGFEIKGVATTLLNLSHQGYDAPRATQFMTRYVEGLSAIPGVTDVARAECAPLAHDFSGDHFTLQGSSEQIPIEYNHVTPSYFSLTGIPIVRGRNFTAAEMARCLRRWSHGIDGSPAMARSGPVGANAARDLGPCEDRDRDRPRRAGLAPGDSTSNYLYHPLGLKITRAATFWFAMQRASMTCPMECAQQRCRLIPTSPST